MSEPTEGESSAALAGALSQWLGRAGVQRPEPAVDLADLLYAAKRVEVALQSLLSMNPTDRAQAEPVIDKLGELHAWLFTEMKHHLEELEAAWSTIEAPVIALLSDE